VQFGSNAKTVIHSFDPRRRDNNGSSTSGEQSFLLLDNLTRARCMSFLCPRIAVVEP
jgi:hypothetical protein